MAGCAGLLAVALSSPAAGLDQSGAGSCLIGSESTMGYGQAECEAAGGAWSPPSTATTVEPTTAPTSVAEPSTTSSTAATTSSTAATTTATAATTTTTVPPPPTTSSTPTRQLEVAEEARDVLTLGLGLLVFCAFSALGLRAGRG